MRSQAQRQADLVAATAADMLGAAQRADLTRLAATAARGAGGRIIVVDASGIVLADRGAVLPGGRPAPPELGAQYATPLRPEVISALRGVPVQLQRYSDTVRQALLATAVPILRNGVPVGAVRVTQAVGAVDAAVTRVELGLALIGVIVIALGLLAGRVIAGGIAGPLRRLEEVAQRVAGGDTGARAPVEGSREQRSLAESFNEMTDRLGRLVGSQRAFVEDASHQLRTPLTGLRLRIEEAREQGVSPAAAAQLDAGIAEVDRLAAIVEELLVLGRAGERELPGERLALAEVIERALTRWSAAASERGVGLERGELEGGAVWCAAADADRALDVLLENAVAYSPPAARVTVASAPGRIEVRDRGPGLDAGEEEAVFERFHRGSAGRAGPAGSGLGLAIARELARAWGGEVTLRAREGGGAVATLSLPQEPPAR